MTNRMKRYLLFLSAFLWMSCQNVPSDGCYYTSKEKGYVYDLAVRSNKLYVLNYYNRLAILDISIPSAPVLITNIILENSLSNQAILVCPDVYSDPAPEYAKDFSIDGNNIYIATGIVGWGGIDILDLDTLEHNKILNDRQTFQWLAAHSNYIFTEMLVVVVTNKYEPHTPAGVDMQDPKLIENGLLFSYYYQFPSVKIRIYDIADITNILNLSTIILGDISCYSETKNVLNPIVINSNYLYCVQWDKGIGIIDISEVTNPILYKEYTNFVSMGIAYTNGYLYSTGEDFRIFLVQDLTNLTQVGIISGESGLGIVVNGDYAYVGAVSDGLRIINISNKSNPQLVKVVKFN